MRAFTHLDKITIDIELALYPNNIKQQNHNNNHDAYKYVNQIPVIYSKTQCNAEHPAEFIIKTQNFTRSLFPLRWQHL